MSGSGSRSTYRSKAILRSTLPSGALLMAAIICCRSSSCSAAGSTTRAAATGSTEPKRLRQLSGVAHHIAKHGKPVTKRHHFVGIAEMTCFREATKTCADHFRDVTKLLLCGVHPGNVTGMAVCSATHGFTPYLPALRCTRHLCQKAIFAKLSIVAFQVTHLFTLAGLIHSVCRSGNNASHRYSHDILLTSRSRAFSLPVPFSSC